MRLLHRHRWWLLDFAHGTITNRYGLERDETWVYLKCECGRTREEHRLGHLPARLVRELYEHRPDPDAFRRGLDEVEALLGRWPHRLVDPKERRAV